MSPLACLLFLLLPLRLLSVSPVLVTRALVLPLPCPPPVSGCQKSKKDLVAAPSIFSINSDMDDVKGKTSKYTKLHEAGACAALSC